MVSAADSVPLIVRLVVRVWLWAPIIHWGECRWRFAKSESYPESRPYAAPLGSLSRLYKKLCLRKIIISDDKFFLQNDIDKLFTWSYSNKMKFHPSKCKALSVTNQLNILHNSPLTIFNYRLGPKYIWYWLCCLSDRPRNFSKC